MKKYVIVLLAIGIGFLFYFNNDQSAKIETATNDDYQLDGLTGAEKFALYHSSIRKSPEGSPYRYKSGYQVKEYQKLKNLTSIFRIESWVVGLKVLMLSTSSSKSSTL